MKVTLDLAIDPTPWKAPHMGAHGIYAPHNEVKRKIKHFIRQQYQGQPYTGYTALFFYFAFAVPQSASVIQRKRMLDQKIYPTKMDCTNCQKLFEDCLQGIVISNDKNVVAVTSCKFYEEKGRVQIIVQDVNDYMKEIEGVISDAVKEGKKQESDIREYRNRDARGKAPETSDCDCI